ncbi:MAG: cell division protein ZapA [Bacteroidales bacterium]|nr:cell division protein ZapA [Bacteroidales bacterium]MBR5862123.1 cell division protein ZapA [Bacteroidales bacterium]
MAQSIKVVIAEHTYPLQVNSPEHEELIRKAAADVNQRVKYYLEKYPTKGTKEVLALVALNLGITNFGLKNQITEMANQEETLLKELEGYLDNIDKNSR